MSNCSFVDFNDDFAVNISDLTILIEGWNNPSLGNYGISDLTNLIDNWETTFSQPEPDTDPEPEAELELEPKSEPEP
jgi:hypothetical protein